MKIKNIILKSFKRFSDLSIINIPESARLVVLVGPNGCGKSSIFDAFKVWQLWNGFNALPNDQNYCNKIKAGDDGFRNSNELVTVEFYKYDASDKLKNHQLFYFRTAYRNESSLAIKQASSVESPIAIADKKMMIENDQEVGKNYQRLVYKTLEKLYDTSNNSKIVSTLREELIGKIKKALLNVFSDLVLSGIGNPIEKPDFLFDKGVSHDYSYMNLSGGEKAVFDLLLDLVVKCDYYPDAVFCIDEPEAHLHTSLQFKLLGEIYSLIGEKNQLWIATHSLGMIEKARQLEKEHPGSVVFLNFDGYNFDDAVEISPSPASSGLWSKLLNLTIDSYANTIAPKIIVFCEGNNQGHKRKDFDANCYANIFKNNYPNVVFYSLGGCNDIEEDKLKVIELSKVLAPNTEIIRLIDRGDRSTVEIEELNAKRIKVLSKRNIESYILDDEILRKWCTKSEKPNCLETILSAKADAMSGSRDRGNAIDDTKSASNVIATNAVKILGLAGCGNTGEAIMRDTITLLITPETNIYKKLESEIFTRDN